MKQANEKKSERRTASYDPELMVEAYQFQGVMQAFPNHFHEHYVVGFIERGRRKLKVRGECLLIAPGDLLLELELAVPGAVTDAQKAAWARLAEAYPGFDPRGA